MKLTDLPVLELLERIRSPEPTPGGGSASALAGAMGASLLAMVAAMVKHRARSDDDEVMLRAAGRQCADLAERLAALVDVDSAAYEGVVEAYRLPRASDPEKAHRSARIQEALKAAAEAPLDVMRACARAADAALVVASFGNPTAGTDVAVGVELLAAALRGARLNVDVNLASIKDEHFVTGVREQSAALAGRCTAAVTAAAARLDRMAD